MLRVHRDFNGLLKDVQEQYADYDPDEKVKELFKGDRRFMENR